ncbi:CHRD domain-containing protein [soil metagenome]
MKRTVMCVVAALAAATGCTQSDTSVAEPETLLVPVFASENARSGNYHAHASGREEVPANNSRAQGQAMFRLSADGTELNYKLIVANIQNVTQAHIHNAPAGQNGPIVVWLYPSSPPAMLIPGRFNGELAEGVITNANVLGGMTLTQLVALLEAGNAYVNVHTSQYPPGEVRGQIR